MSYLYAKLHDQNGEVDPTELTSDGRRNAAYQCYRLLQEIVEADDADQESEAQNPCVGIDFAGLAS